MINFKSHSGIHTLTLTQHIPIDIEQAWDFMSSPRNLSLITPDNMGFQVTSDMDSEKMYPGQIITYKVSPILGIKLNWVTEITHVVKKQSEAHFVDEQRFGPYALWHHKHFLKEVEGGTEMRDIVSYKLPMGPFGNIANGIFVRKQLRGIFSYRYAKLVELFGEFSTPTDS